MQSTFKIEKEVNTIRKWLIFFMIALFLSGLTAIPILWELEWLTRFFSIDSPIGFWLDKVYLGAKETGTRYPLLFIEKLLFQLHLLQGILCDESYGNR